MSGVWQRVVVVAIIAAAGGCTVVGPSDAPPPGVGPAGATAAATSTSSTGAACPWADGRGQEYEPETGRIRLVSTCLATQHVHGAGGWVYRTSAVADRIDRYTDGTDVAVVCIEFNGERHTDKDGHSSAVWFRIDGTFADGYGQGWVPHVATGYAHTRIEGACPA